MLKDGYYLSTYTIVDPLASFYESMIRHDQNISLWLKNGRDIELIHHWELERVSGMKHHHIAFYTPHDFYKYIGVLLQKYNITFSEIQAIIGTPVISTVDDYYNNGDFGGKYTYHTISHLFSSLIMDSDIFYKDNILAFCLDGGSDSLIDYDTKNKHEFIGVYTIRGKIEYFPITSPGPYWTELKRQFNYEEGTLMALATASSSKSLEQLYKKDDFYDCDVSSIQKFVKKIIDRIFSYQEIDSGIHFNCFDKRFSENDNKISMVMKIMQEISIIIVDEMIKSAIENYNIKTDETYLGLSGGYALNCPTNTYLQNKYKFKGQSIPPCTNDGGQAIGMGLYYFYKHLDSFNFKLKNSYYGDSDETLFQIINDSKYQNYIEHLQDNLDSFFNDIVNEPLIWFDGKSEIGPRALGHRSILADPRTNISKDLLNHIKKRQWWRPVAPIILEQELANWFENSYSSPYMLNNFVLKDDKRDLAPAIEHIDHTCRVQSISKNDDTRLYSVIEDFYEKTGVPMLINTSLNDRGEPIINSIEQAMNFALRKKIRVIYVNGIRVCIKNHHLYTKEEPLQRNNFVFNRNHKDDIIKYNPYDLSNEEYLFYYKKLRNLNLSLNNEDDVKKIKKMQKKFFALTKFLYL